MPPRSAKRKASTRAKKTTSKKIDIEPSILADENIKMSDSEFKSPESSRLEEIVVPQLGNESVAAHPVVEEEEIKNEVEPIMNGNSDETEGFTCGGSSVVKYRVKEELVEEEIDIDNVMKDHNTEESVNMEVENHKNCDENIIIMEEVENDKNCDGNIIIMEDKGENAGEERERADGIDGLQSGIVPVAELHSAEEETASVQINIGEARVDNDNLFVVREGRNGKGEGEDSQDNEDSEEDPSVFTHDLLTDRSRQKNLEIFVGRLDKGAVEDDLVKVFGTFGEIKSTRIIRNSTTKKSKGYAFIGYATIEQAKNALSKLKDGLEVRGRRVKVSASQDNDTLYVGNICKTWTKELVLEMLKHYGVDNTEEIHLPDDPKNVGRIKGFALLEFSTHSDAMAAFQLLISPDAVFGCDRSAKVAFAQTPLHPNEELLSQVKRVYMEGLTDAWNEEKMKEICKQYGEIIEVKLCQNLRTKRKDFGFITFCSRESALACVEGINNAQIVEGEVKVKASIAKPQSKGRLQKQGFRGGFKVKQMSKVSPSRKESEMTKQAGSSPVKGHAKSKRSKRKGKAKVEEKGKALPESRTVDSGNPNKSRSRTRGRSVEATFKLERTNLKRKTLSTKVEGRGSGSGGIELSYNKRPPKKPRGNMRGRPGNNNRNPKRDPQLRKRPDYGADYKNPYTLENDTSTAYYQGHGHSSISASKRQYTDMEPHAGYIEPAAVKQGRLSSGYLDPAVGTKVQPHAGYLEPAAGTGGQPYIGYLESAVRLQGRHVRYLEPTVWMQGRPRGGYLESAVRTHGQPHAGYVQPAVGKHSHDSYDPRLGRAGGLDGQSSGGYAYGEVGSTLQPSYTRSYLSYAGYEGSSAGGYYQSSAACPPGRAYHQTKY